MFLDRKSMILEIFDFSSIFDILIFRCLFWAKTRGGRSEAREPTICHDFRSKIYDFIFHQVLDFDHLGENAWRTERSDGACPMKERAVYSRSLGCVTGCRVIA